MSAAERLRGDWNFPTAVRFGAGRIAELGAACRELGMTRPLLVTDRGLKQSEIVARALDACPGAALFAEVQGNPVEANVEDGVAAYRDGGHDGVIAFGGGSGIDAAKNIALMVGQSRPLMDFVDEGDNWTRVNVAGMAPVVAVPTTAGTGSEVGRSAVVTEIVEATGEKRKRVIFHPGMLPALVIADPELTVGLPAPITAAVGMDALSHSLEAFCCAGYHPMADGIALEGMRLVKEWLPRAVADGGDLEARAHMLAAASMGATAFQKGLGAMHAMSHPCSAHFDTHHGLTNAVLMPYVLAYNRPAIEAKMELLARYLGLGLGPGFDAVLDWVLALRREIAIPHGLAEIGVPADKADFLAPLAEADPLTGLNPRPIAAADYLVLYEQALAGKLSH